jgi:4-amino-4-deoxy-L-arabinose transferase-like glycosyltransferase
MGRRSCAAFLLLSVASFAWATSWDDDSHYVSLGQRNGYYIVRPDSHLFWQLGLYEAPIIDTADPLRHGYGADALAFRFNRNGVLIAPPAYIAQESPNDFYTRRIGSLARGRATVHDVEALFGRGHSRANHPNGFMWYYALPVYNPFEERGGHR